MTPEDQREFDRLRWQASVILEQKEELERKLGEATLAIQTMQGEIDYWKAELEKVNSPLFEPFAEAVINEARHQRSIGRDAGDETKTPWDWFWTLGYLSQKAAAAAAAGNRKKALHHTISSAALLCNWHRMLRAELPAELPFGQPMNDQTVAGIVAEMAASGDFNE
jgi:hypothetical protein